MNIRRVMLALLFAMSLAGNVLHAQTSGFYAYYTRLPNPYLEDREAYFREDAQRFRDIVVNVGDEGRFVFSAAEAYMPYWKTPQGRYELDESFARELDRECLYSHARILEKSAEKIVVHWQYYPSLSDMGFASAVHEYFEFTPDGKVVRRVVEALEKLDEYRDPGNVDTRIYQLQPGGMDLKSHSPARLVNGSGEALEGNVLSAKGSGRPVLWLSMDDGMQERQSRYTCTDRITDKKATINGGMALWKKGVSGTCLAFDGYHSSVSLSGSDVPDLGDSFTVGAWVALGAYPWHDVPVIHQSTHLSGTESSKERGYYLGIDTDGRPFFAVGGERISHGEKMELGLYQWHFLAASFGEGRMRLYLDGKEVASSRTKEKPDLPETDLLIGLNREARRMRTSEWHRDEEQNLPFVFGVEGLIDEVMLFDRVLTAEEVQESFRDISALPTKADMEPRILPGEVDGQPAEQFGAYYADLKYHDLWDNMWRLSETPDVAVRFDLLPAAVTYWHGQNYAAGWVTENNQWMADQSCEDWGEHGCAEHMSDKQCRHCYVRIIENTPARSIVHWRYRSIDIGYKPCEIEDYCWTDEYHTFYPDGAAVRRVVWNQYGFPSPGWQDIQIFMQPGSSAADLLHIDAMSMANLEGETEVLNYSDGNPDLSLKNALIQMVNFKSDYKVFMIAPPETEFETWIDPFVNRWDHWPVGQYPSDGRDAVALDRVAHAALSSSNIHYKGNMAIYGLSNKSVEELVPLARSWNMPPGIVAKKGCEDAGYMPSERAYSIIAREQVLEFTLEGSEEQVIFNPGFVIGNWNSDRIPELLMDGKALSAGRDYRMGIERNPMGKQNLVIWVALEGTEPVTFSLEGADPDTDAPSPAQTIWSLPPVRDESGGLGIQMAAHEAEDKSGVSYYFECVNEPDFSSSWQAGPEYVARGLHPEREYTFRVRTRDLYRNMTAFSEPVSVSTGKAPPPLARWSFDGEGSPGADEKALFPARVEGAVSAEGRLGNGLEFKGKERLVVEKDGRLSTEEDFTWTAWIKTSSAGTLMAKSGESDFADGFKCWYINEEGFPVFENYFGRIVSEIRVNDGSWKHLAVTVDITPAHDIINLYVDGKLAASGTLNLKRHDAKGLPVKIGYCGEDYTEEDSPPFTGVMDEVSWYDYVLGPGHIKEIRDQE